MDDTPRTGKGIYVVDRNTGRRGDDIRFYEKTVSMSAEQKLEMRILELEARLDDIRDCVEKIRKFLP